MTRSHFASLAAATALLFLAAPTQAALTLDAKFDGDGLAPYDFAANLDSARDLALTKDGGLVMVGLSRQGSFDYLAAVRLSENGSLPKGFGDGTSLAILPGGTPEPFGGADGRAVAIQDEDQKIVLAGSWNQNDGSGYRILVVRLFEDGSLDGDFGDGGVLLLTFPEIFGATAEAVAVDADGNILVAGGSTSPGNVRGFVLRLTPKGEMDETFAGDGLFSMEHPSPGDVLLFKTVEPLDSGGVLAAGGSGDMLVLRLDKNGVPDASFSGDGVTTVNVGTYQVGDFTINTYEDTHACALLDDGRLLLGGSTSGASPGAKAVLVRLTAGGAKDETFGNGGVFPIPGAPVNSAVYDVALHFGGDYVVAGLGIPPTQVSQNANAVEELVGAFPLQAVSALVVDSEERILGAGEQNIAGPDYEFVALRLGVEFLPDPDCTACGEISGDCRITTGDALTTLRMAVDQIPDQGRADMDGSGTITAGDALTILRVAVGIGEPGTLCGEFE